MSRSNHPKIASQSKWTAGREDAGKSLVLVDQQIGLQLDHVTYTALIPGQLPINAISQKLGVFSQEVQPNLSPLVSVDG